jgi:ATP-dependent Lhr-like helicase
MIKSLEWAHPLVYEWFTNQVGIPTEPQQQGWPHILNGEHTLISAPTGSGKTFAAFLVCIDHLVKKAIAGTLNNETEVLYISPLKAVANDVQKNLLAPLKSINELAEKNHGSMTGINVAVRTGDTPTKERQAMLKKPPHILVTTPESLYILLTAEKSRLILQNIKTVIVDEIHALANDKRGSHLSLSLERLEMITLTPPIRIGLSATLKPIELIASFIAGSMRLPPVIINIGHKKHLDIQVEVPKTRLSAVASNDQWEEIYNHLAELAKQHRSTLIFANTRRVAERTAHHLAERLGQDKVLAHHGSLSRKLRLHAETQLKNGELTALVATASLELGIDIGSVDLVCQLGSPRSISVMLQRIGRAGHWHGAVSKGRIFATTRDELIECAALVNAIQNNFLDQLIMPQQPLDILAQQIVASCATNEWFEEDLFQMIKRSFPYKDLSRETFNALIEILSEGIAGSRGRYGAYLFRDRVNGMVKGRRGSRLTAITNGGAIPDNSLFTVVAEPEGIIVGTLDEDFAVESNRGDIILLGSTSWKIRRVESTAGRVIVEDAHGSPPTVPFWRGEAPARTNELSLNYSNLLEIISKKLDSDGDRWLEEQCKVTPYGAEQIIEYVKEGRILLGAVPSQNCLIAERFFDESGGMQLIIHSPFGARINKAWGLALRKCFCRNFNFELQASATDNGLNISLTDKHSFPLQDVFNYLHLNTIIQVLTQAVLQSPLFTTRWRWDAGRSLSLVRFRNGKKIPPNILRMRAEDLLASVFPDAVACQDNLTGEYIELPDHPLINEVMKDCLHEALDLNGLINVLNKIKTKEIQCMAIDTPMPSVFSHELLNANPYAFLDDAPLEERRARAVEMRRMLPQHLIQQLGTLDAEAIKTVKEQAWPDIRNKDELHDTLQTLIAYPAVKFPDSTHQWYSLFEELIATGRAGSALVDSHLFWFSVEKAKTFSLIYPQAVLNHKLQNIEQPQEDQEECILGMVQNWMHILGPITNKKLAQLLFLNASQIEHALLRLESMGVILRGSFTSNEQEWCERRLLARIHQLTLARLRKEIEPVTALELMRWLLNWQHVAPGTQLHGEQGLLSILEQLQGFELPAKSWETHIFRKRLINYDPQWLDRLCLMGIIGWGRFSNSAVENNNLIEIKRIIPTSVAPITFFIRDKSQWIINEQNSVNETTLKNLGYIAKSIAVYLHQNGASFFTDMVNELNFLKSEIEMGLWELVASGFATADAFDNLRSLIDPRRRLNRKRRHHAPHQYSSGRWSLLKVSSSKNHEEQIEATCWLLLKRYGVVFRELLAREKIIPPWRHLLIGFRRLEDLGKIRGGRFVEGFLGEQFALSTAVQSLRAIKRKAPDQETISLSAADPLNVVGFILPGTRITARAKGTVKLLNGKLVDFT